MPSKRYDIIVSVDEGGLSECINNTLANYSEIISHIFYNRNSKIINRKLTKLSNHYKHANNFVCNTLKYDLWIVLEDDLLLLGDFFSYFTQMEKLFLNDRSIFIINSHNHHSHKDVAYNPYHFYRMEAFNTYLKKYS